MTEKEKDHYDVIVYLSGGVKALAKVHQDELSKFDEDGPVEIRDVWAIHQMLVPSPLDPTKPAEEQGQGVTQQTLLMPLPGMNGKVTTMSVRPEAWLFPDESKQSSYINGLLSQVQESEVIHRAKKAGITLAKPGAMPAVTPPRR